MTDIPASLGTFARRGSAVQISTRRLSAAITVLFLLAMWTPSDGIGSNWLEIGRYFAFAVLASLVATYGLLKRSRRWVWRPEAVFTVLFVFYAVVSVLWSELTAFSFAKACLLLITSGMCLAVARHLELGAIVRSFVNASAFFVVIGVLAVFLVPSIGIEDSWTHAGKWRGLAAQKNQFGAIAAISFVGVLVLATHGGTRSSAWPNRLTRYTILLLSLAAVVMSGSRGAQVSAVVGVTVVVGTLVPRNLRGPLLGGTLIFGLTLAVAGLSTLAIDVASGALSVFGFELDSSNRLVIWEYGLKGMDGRELFGLGLGGFWTEARTEAFLSSQGWVLANFHNGYLSAFVEFGIAGMALLMMTVLTTLRATARSLAERESYITASACILSMFLCSNLFENWIVRSTNFYLIIFVMLAFSIGQLRRRASPTT